MYEPPPPPPEIEPRPPRTWVAWYSGVAGLAGLIIVAASLVGRFVLVGPVIFVGLIRHRPTRQRFAMGVFSAFALIGSGYVMREVAGQGTVAMIGWLAAMWLGSLVVGMIQSRGGAGAREARIGSKKMMYDAITEAAE